jgi:hypothetical protein
MPSQFHNRKGYLKIKIGETGITLGGCSTLPSTSVKLFAIEMPHAISIGSES